MRATALALALATSALASACLPRGPAPAGRRLLADTTAYQVQFVPGPAGAPGGLVALKLASDDIGHFSIYSIKEPSSGDGLGTETFLVDGVEGGLELEPNCGSTVCPALTDDRGRVFVERPSTITSDATPGVVGLVPSFSRLDPRTGEVIDFGSSSQLTGLLRGHGVLAYTLLDSADSLRIRDDDDRDRQLADGVGHSAAVVNGDLYFMSGDTTMGQGALQRLDPSSLDTPATLANDLEYFQAFQADDPALLLCRVASVGCASSVFDPATNQEVAMPNDGANVWSISPSGRYLLTIRLAFDPAISETGPPIISLFDRTLGLQQSTTLTVDMGGTYWRPGYDELWFQGTPFEDDQGMAAPDDHASSLWRWRPGSEPEMVLTQQLPFNPITSDNVWWPFTPDGRFLLTFPTNSQTDKPTVSLRAADVPATELLTLNPTGTGVQDVRQLPDGRLIVSDWITDGSSADIYLVDPDAGTMRSIGHGGNVVVTGATRILAQLDWLSSGGSGSLSVIDLATGATTQLAEDVHAVAVEPPTTGGDRLAPGTRIAYVSRNRVASPYDGLWMTSLP